ncbi:MAG TPA: hypothetical protein VED41_08645 [Solirubrobacteraceae bacterium]|nr:hypothetical protein [Solirubrobacteraceae bacterium]
MTWWLEGHPGGWEDIGDVIPDGGWDPWGPWWADVCAEAEAIATDFVLTELRKRPLPPWTWGASHFVGWSQPPHPVDVVASFNPKASRREQVRSVLLDYYHDDPLRYWSDNEAVKRCFIGGSDPRKENHDPLLLVAAYEDKNHKVWQCRGDKMTWADMDRAVQQAITHRMKLGPLPKPSYDTDPIVIYYYDNDKMKRVTYPLLAVPYALNPNNQRWWAWGAGPGDDASKDAGKSDVHTLETDNPRKIQIERENPGWKTSADLLKIAKKYGRDFQKPSGQIFSGGKKSDPQCPECKGRLSMVLDHGSAGGWDSEGFQWDKDVAGTGVIGSITGAILALVSAILDVTGIGAVIGVPLGIATPFIVAAINATDTALHAGDFGAALSGLATALASATVQALSKTNVSIPPAAVQALGQTVASVSSAVRAGQDKKLDFGQIWQDVAQRAKSFGKLGDAEAVTIAEMLSGQGPQAGHVFIQGYLAGKLLDMTAISAIAKLLQAYANFADPRIINLGLLGMGIGYITKSQQGTSAFSSGTISRAAPGARPAAGAPAARGSWAGQVVLEDGVTAAEDLEDFVYAVLAPRYGLRSPRHVAGFQCPDGYGLVATDNQIACAYRGSAPCLAGVVNERGDFVCTVRDFDCPPGMSTRPGSPSNWCFPTSHLAGQIAPPAPQGPPDWSWPALGCPRGYWNDTLSGQCKPLPAPPILPPPRTSYYDYA